MPTCRNRAGSRSKFVIKSAFADLYRSRGREDFVARMASHGAAAHHLKPLDVARKNSELPGALLACDFVETSHPVEIFRVTAFSDRLRFRINAGRPDNADRLGDVVRTKPSSEKDANVNLLDNPLTDVPVVRHAKGANLPVRRTVAVQQKIIGNAFVAPSDLDAFLPVNGDAAHYRAARQRRPNGRDLCRSEQFGRRSQMDDAGFSAQPIK